MLTLLCPCRLQESTGSGAELPGGACDLLVGAHGHRGNGREEPAHLRQDHARIVERDRAAVGFLIARQADCGATPGEDPNEPLRQFGGSANYCITVLCMRMYI